MTTTNFVNQETVIQASWLNDVDAVVYESVYPIQRVSTTVSTVSTGTTAMPIDNTTPQNTEGDEYMSLSITPTSSTSILIIDVVGHFGISADANLFGMALFQDSTAGALSAVVTKSAQAVDVKNLVLRHKMTAGTTSSTTFKVRAGGATGATTTFNGSAGAVLLNVLCSSIVITEYRA